MDEAEDRGKCVSYSAKAPIPLEFSSFSQDLWGENILLLLCHRGLVGALLGLYFFILAIFPRTRGNALWPFPFSTREGARGFLTGFFTWLTGAEVGGHGRRVLLNAGKLMKQLTETKEILVTSLGEMEVCDYSRANKYALGCFTAIPGITEHISLVRAAVNQRT